MAGFCGKDVACIILLAPIAATGLGLSCGEVSAGRDRGVEAREEQKGPVRCYAKNMLSLTEHACP